MQTDKNYNFPQMMIRPDGVVVPIPVSPTTGAIRMEAIAATGTIVPPTGDEVAKVDGNFNPVTMIRRPDGAIIQARVGPITKRLRVEIK